MQGHERTTSKPSLVTENVESPTVDTDFYEPQHLDIAQCNHRNSFSSYSYLRRSFGNESQGVSEDRMKDTHDDQTRIKANIEQDVKTQDKSESRMISSNAEKESPDTRTEKLAKAIRGRSKLVYLRNQTEISTRNYGVSRLHHSNKRKEFLESCHQIQTHLEKVKGISAEAVSKLADLLQSLHADDDVMRVQEGTLETLEKSLSVQGMKMIRLDNRLMGLERTALRGEESNSEPEYKSIDGRESKGGESPSTWSAHSASSVTHPAAARYYDMVGDMILAREHIHNVDAGHRSNLYLRKSRRDLGILTEETDISVYKDYMEERELLMKDFAEAKAEADAAWQECQKLNVQVDKADIPDLQPPVSFLDQSDPALSTFRGPGWVGQDEEGVGSLGITNSRVVEWVAETKTAPLEDITEHQSPLNTGPLEIQLMKGYSPVEPRGFLQNSRPPSETDSDHERQIRTFTGEKPSRRYSDPERMSVGRIIRDAGAFRTSKDRSIPSTGVVFGAHKD